ncbi:MAG: amidohydrolase family protein [Pseudomonadota bacterium]
MGHHVLSRLTGTTLLATATLATATLATAETSRYDIMLVGNRAGEMVMEQATPDRATMTFSFNDRGRGPDISAEYRVNEAGLPVEVRITGVDYMKAEVEENVRFTDGVWEWQSAADAGSSAEPGFYTSLDGPPGETTLLIRALLADDDRTIPLLPQGEATLEIVGEHSFDDGVTVRLAELSGLGFEPFPVWLDENDGIFAVVSGWFGMVPVGRSDVMEVLQAAQDERRDARYRILGDAAVTPFDGPVVIDNARIIEVVDGKVLTANAVVVEDERIAAVLEPDEARPTGATVIDAGGRTLLPGLWDMHTHLSPGDGALHLAAGVTTVRDLANDHDQVMQVQKAWDSGEAPGPHVFRSGFIDGTGPFAGPTKARIQTAEQAAEWIDFYAEHGYSQVKIYSSIPIDLVEGMAERAHGHGMRFSGHVPAGMWAEDAVRAGYDEIQHINMIFLNFYKDIVETRNPDRFIKVAERGADLDPDSAPFQAFVQLLLENGTVVDPTVAIFMDLFAHVPGQLAPSLGTADGRLPPQVYRGNLKGGLPVPEGWKERYDASGQQMLKVIKALHDAGVPIVAGTDAMAGFVLQRELAYYQEAGIAPLDIIRLATFGSAKVMGVEHEVGQIAPGQRADLILIDGRPDEDIGEIGKVSWVMKAGEAVDPALLYQSMSIQTIASVR